MTEQPRFRSAVAVEMHKVEAETSVEQGQKQPTKESVELMFREVGYSVQVVSPVTKKCVCAPPYTSDHQTKTILKGVTGIIRPQRLTCILGASGAGKTSLLNILSGSLVSGTLSGQMVRMPTASLFLR
jgi:ABC-type transport system involved in cytochrome bd biosynthesis fused ATPase/permease subunit